MSRYALNIPYELLVGRAAFDPPFCRALLRDPIGAAVSVGWPLSEAVSFAGVCAGTLAQFARITYPLVYGHEHAVTLLTRRAG